LARVGIFGGTFNPPHVGHLACLEAALARLELDRVMLVPVSQPPHKAAAEDPGPEHRLEMCRRAALGDGRIGVCDFEVRQGGPSYTVDTLRALHDAHPEDELTFIAGGDMAASLPGWREPEEVLALARFGVAERTGAEREEVEWALAGLQGRDRVVFFDMPRVDVSSTAVRRGVGDGRPVRDLVPDAVARYIDEHGLYRAAGPGAVGSAEAAR
jgi:nicotinate-nucleotide adenylyltransferase